VADSRNGGWPGELDALGRSERWSAADASWEANRCWGCGSSIFDQPVWRVRCPVRGALADSYALVPLCEHCGPAAVEDAHRWRGGYGKPRRLAARRPRPCEGCGRLVVDTEWRQRTITVCSERCRRDARSVERRGAGHAKACARCGQSFPAVRSDARFCSTRCRVAAHRAELGELGPGAA
jgi:hypothetical protein